MIEFPAIEEADTGLLLLSTINIAVCLLEFNFQQFSNRLQRSSTIEIINTLLKIGCGKYYEVKNQCFAWEKLLETFYVLSWSEWCGFFFSGFRQTTHLSHLDYMNCEWKLHGNWTEWHNLQDSNENSRTIATRFERVMLFKCMNCPYA